MALAGEEEEEGTSPLHTFLQLLRNHSSRTRGVRREKLHGTKEAQILKDVWVWIQDSKTLPRQKT